MLYGKNLQSSRDRFDYLYARDELAPWAVRAQRLAEQVKSSGQVHFVMNNNARNYGIVNAFDMQALLGQPVGKGEPLPPGVEETITERTERAAQSVGG